MVRRAEIADRVVPISRKWGRHIRTTPRLATCNLPNSRAWSILAACAPKVPAAGSFSWQGALLLRGFADNSAAFRGWPRAMVDEIAIGGNPRRIARLPASSANRILSLHNTSPFGDSQAQRR